MTKHSIITQDFLSDLELLACFEPAPNSSGVQVEEQARPQLQAAAKRLHKKGLITLPNGGFLTQKGEELLHHLQELLGALRGGNGDILRLRG